MEVRHSLEWRLPVTLPGPLRRREAARLRTRPQRSRHSRDLVAVHRPPAVLLENVPGLLSSHGGRDMAALVGALVELGYGVGYRVLDARHFGVPQRRRRVFILGLTPGGRAGAERAAEVLSVGSRCRRHPPTGVEAGEGAAAGAGDGIVGTLNFGAHIGIQPDGQSAYSGQLIPVGAPPDPDGMRAPDGLAGRLDDRGGVVTGLTQGLGSGGPDAAHAQAGWLIPVGPGGVSDDGLPLGLDSHRYRCCGNGVVSSVADWIGYRLADALR